MHASLRSCIFVVAGNYVWNKLVFPIEIEQWFEISGKEDGIVNFCLKFIIANPSLGQGVIGQKRRRLN